MIFGTWNVHTLTDSENTLTPERRTALITREVDDCNLYKIDIAALSEMRLPEEGSICKPKGGYTFFRKGKGVNEDSIHRQDLLSELHICTSYQISQHTAMNS